MQIDSSKGYVIRKANERGFFDHGWLKTYHTFSFSEYYDPAFMGFRALRVINEDTVSPNKGFPTHGHQDMEIITIVLQGAVEHKDSMGNKKQIRENEIQVMSAGQGVTHSEYNPLSDQSSRFLQIWVLPKEKGTEPSYAQKSLPKLENEWILLASETGEQESLLIGQDVRIFMLDITSNHKIEKTIGPGRYGWIQVISGKIDLNGEELNPGDGVAINTKISLKIQSKDPAKILFFDLN